MNCNLILNIPHASTWIPETCRPKESMEYRILKEDQLNMTDWYTDELFLTGIGVPVIAPVSRMVCDTERFRNDADEPMSRIGMGVCYTRTHDLTHTINWSDEHKEWVLDNLYDIHHRNLELAVDRALYEHGKAIILDCHSFYPVPLPYEPDRTPDRPDICIGTDPFHTPEKLKEATEVFFRDLGYSVKVNSPYSGTIVPLKHLNTNNKVNSIMLEINRGLYLKENTNQKNEFFPVLKLHLKAFQHAVLMQFS